MFKTVPHKGNEFIALEEKINKCQSIDDLFDLWKNAHKVLSDECFKMTVPVVSDTLGIDYSFMRNFFYKDGMLYKMKYGKNGKKILVLLKESNAEDDIKNKNCRDRFWFQEIYKNNPDNIYVKRIFGIVNKIDSNATLDNIAYMNLNKHGGYGTTNKTQFTNYVKTYNKFIRKQIEFLDPDIIVCFGVYDVFIRYVIGAKVNVRRKFIDGSKYSYRYTKLETPDKVVEIYHMYHPVPVYKNGNLKSDRFYVDLFEKLYFE
ncbi:MAG TPA: hypothetical protein GX505_00365 [Clostridiales bacterium]|nr:hypothetical protein [Clostridiales bacterium]